MMPPTSRHQTTNPVWACWVAALVVLWGGAGQVWAYTHFLDQNTKGQVSAAHWDDSKLPLLFSIDKEDDFTVEGRTALQIAKDAVILWKQIPGCRMSLQVEQLTKDINSTNFSQEVKLGDKRHELVIEHDGKILQSLGLDPDFVVGVGIPVTETNPQGDLKGPFGGQIIDAFVVINTKQTWNIARLQRLLTHELGHVLGLGHTGVSHLRFAEELPVMFYDPLQQDGAALLHIDDRAGLASLYPKKDIEQHYGAIKGKVLRSDQSPVFGVAVFATNDKMGPVGTWTRQDGSFALYGLLPGKYSILVRAIDGSEEVKGMKPSSHIGGLISKAATSFCPEFFNDQVFTNCRFPVSSFWTLQVEAGRTLTPVLIEEGGGNRSALPQCVLGAAPALEGRPHGLDPLPSGKRGDPCPLPPEPPPSEEPPPQEVAPPEVIQREQVLTDDASSDVTAPPICGCQSSELPGVGLLCLLGLFFLRRGKRRVGR